MIEFLKSWVLNIVTLVIVIVLLEIMMPSGKIKKFINLASGFILLIAIITPLLGLVNKGVDLKEIQAANSLYIDRKEIENNSKVLKDKQMKQVVDVYRAKLIKQVEESIKGIKDISVAKADVIINEDYNSESFGEVKRVYLDIAMNNGKQIVKPVTKVEKIEVRKPTKDKIEGKEGAEIDSKLKKNLEQNVSKILGVTGDKIVIKMVKE